MPSGTVARKVNVALSVGLSLTGIHAGAPCGSPGTNTPSSVGTQPSIEPSGSVMTGGVPSYDTVTVKVCPALSFGLGVTTSSWPSRVKSAGCLPTFNDVIFGPWKSRLNLSMSWVASAVMTVVAFMILVAGSYEKVTS